MATSLPPPTGQPVRWVDLPPVQPRSPQLVPLPPRRHFYAGYTWKHWVMLVVGLVVLAVLFGPFYLRAVL